MKIQILKKPTEQLQNYQCWLRAEMMSKMNLLLKNIPEGQGNSAWFYKILPF